MSPPKPLAILADDDDNVLRSIRIVLSPICDIKTFTNAADTIEAVRVFRPDVVILDLRMPERDGLWAFTRIREFDEQVPIIFNAAFQSELPPADLPAECKPFGVLPKNGNVREFVNLVKLAIQSRQEGRNR